MSRRSSAMEDYLKTLKEAFKIFDEDNSGSITLEEMRSVLRKLQIPLDDRAIECLFKAADADNSGEISLNEFLKKMTSTYGSTHLPRSKIREIFKLVRELVQEFARFSHFDKNSDGYIHTNELVDVFAQLDKKVTKDQIQVMLKGVDLNADGYISFEEFERLLNC